MLDPYLEGCLYVRVNLSIAPLDLHQKQHNKSHDSEYILSSPGKSGENEVIFET